MVFASLPRSDQRRKGRDYLHGLLSTPGRKSVRRIAAQIGGSGTGQSLHHFICSSTWDWTPVRRALAQHVMHAARPRAWVVRPLPISKSDRRPAGAGHDPAYAGHDPAGADGFRTAQRAVGVWLASESASVPVDWHLHLPEGEAGGTLADRAADACLALRSEWDLPARPIVMDLRDSHPVGALRRMRAAGTHPVARVSPELELTVTDPALTGHVGRVLMAADIMRAARALRRPVGEHGGPARGRALRPGRRPELVAAVGVGSPGAAFALVGIGPSAMDWPGELWLTTLPPEQAAAGVAPVRGLLRTTELAQYAIGDHVGIRDYAGRSFSGWHRHITLASTAHAAAALARSDDRPGERHT
ncbi:transposase [Nocardiopsis mangrovi]|uniref:Transposase n=1 Tax=Nocardiopsis mangrovi TaxID=1179818 RepID=A0ABV9DS29_9ACTN